MACNSYKAIRRIQSSILFVCLLVSFFVPSAQTLAENPFVGAEGGNGGAPNGSPPPPDFSEDDEFAPDNSFGFTPPQKPNEPSPPTTANPGNSEGLEDPGARRNAKPTYPTGPKSFGNPRASAPTSPSTNSPSTPTVTTVGGKPAPKLADYLELDSSVKGLEVKNFDLPDKDIKDVVTLISKWTGKNFILDNKVRGKITIIGPSQVTLQEAYQAFLSALDANGLTTVQAGKFIRIIESAEARRSPVKTYSGDYAPKDDQFITRIFQLKYINSDEVQREFRDLTTRQGKLFAYEPTNSIIITDTGSNIQRIKEILETLDVKSFETTLHVLRIRNGSAKTISDMLGEIYGSKSGGGASNQPRTFQRSALERTRGGGIISKIIPDEATNSLVVLANQAGFDTLKKLVEKLDVRVTDTGRIHVYYCEYAKAEDLAATLASLAQGGKGTAKKPGSSSSSSPFSPSTPTTPNSPASTPAGGSTGPVTAELEGGARITSDAPTNSLVIIANSADWQTLKRVIKKLDIPRLQVFVESAILEVSLGDTTNVGTNVGLGAPGRGFAGGALTNSGALFNFLAGNPGDGATIPIFAGPSFQVNYPTPNAPGQFTPITVNSFMGLLSLLAQNTNTSILSTPQIIAMDNEKAEFQVVDEIPVQTTFSALPQGTTTGLGGIATTPTGSIDTKKVGIVIKLTPHVNATSRSVRLEIEQKVDNINPTVSPSALQSVSVATTSRVTNTTVVVRDQDYIMLGGMMSDKVLDQTKKVPLLGDIPILGWLFKSKNSTVTKTNLIILMHPRIIDSSFAAANVISENMKKRDIFLNKTNAGEDPFIDTANDIRSGIRAQKERARTEPKFDYRNNNDDDVDKTKSGEKSELDTPSREDNDEAKSDVTPEQDKQNSTPNIPGPRSNQNRPPTNNNQGNNPMDIAPPGDAPMIEGDGEGGN